MIYVIAELSIKPGSAETAAAAARKAVAETNKEDGCIFYEMHLNVSDPTSSSWSNAGNRARRSMRICRRRI